MSTWSAISRWTRCPSLPTMKCGVSKTSLRPVCVCAVIFSLGFRTLRFIPSRILVVPGFTSPLLPFGHKETASGKRHDIYACPIVGFLVLFRYYPTRLVALVPNGLRHREGRVRGILTNFVHSMHTRRLGSSYCRGSAPCRRRRVGPILPLLPGVLDAVDDMGFFLLLEECDLHMQSAYLAFCRSRKVDCARDSTDGRIDAP